MTARMTIQSRFQTTWIAYTAPGEIAFSVHPDVNSTASRQLWWKVRCRDDAWCGNKLVCRHESEHFEPRAFPDLDRRRQHGSHVHT